MIGTACIKIDATVRKFYDAKAFCESQGDRVYEPRDMATNALVRDFALDQLPWGSINTNDNVNDGAGPWIGIGDPDTHDL